MLIRSLTNDSLFLNENSSFKIRIYLVPTYSHKKKVFTHFYTYCTMQDVCVRYDCPFSHLLLHLLELDSFKRGIDVTTSIIVIFIIITFIIKTFKNEGNKSDSMEMKHTFVVLNTYGSPCVQCNCSSTIVMKAVICVCVCVY